MLMCLSTFCYFYLSSYIISIIIVFSYESLTSVSEIFEILVPKYFAIHADFVIISSIFFISIIKLYTKYFFLVTWIFDCLIDQIQDQHPVHGNWYMKRVRMKGTTQICCIKAPNQFADMEQDDVHIYMR